MLMTCSSDATALLLNPDTLEVYKTYHMSVPVRAAAFSPLYDNERMPKYHLILGGGQEARDVAMKESGDGGGFAMKLMNFIHDQDLAIIQGHFGPVHSIQFYPDGRGFISCSEDGYVRLHRFPLEYFTKSFE